MFLEKMTKIWTETGILVNFQQVYNDKVVIIVLENALKIVIFLLVKYEVLTEKKLKK